MNQYSEIEKSYSIEQFHSDILRELFEKRMTKDYIGYAKLLTAYLMYLQAIVGVSQFTPEFIYKNALKFDFFAVIGEYHRRLGLIPAKVYVTPTSMFGYFANRFNKIKAKVDQDG